MKTPMKFHAKCLSMSSALLLGAAASTAAVADVYTDSQGRQMECHPEQVTTTEQKDGHPVAGTLAGGAVGGLAGNQFGKGNGKTAMTAAGAVGGAAVGNNLAQGKTVEHTTEQNHCQPVSG